MGLIETDLEGKVVQMNARSVQLLMPQFFSHGLIGNNLHTLLAKIAPSLLESVQQYEPVSGIIVNQQRQELALTDSNGQVVAKHFVFTVNKIDVSSLMYTFDDITELYEKEKQLNQILQDKAIEQSKFEIASGVLHDIGNAIVGFGAYTTRIKKIIEQNETATLEKLQLFFDKNRASLVTVFGEAKGNAVLDLLNGIIQNQQNTMQEGKNIISDQLKIISHVQEILNIQRQYVTGKSVERQAVNIRGLINDSVAMLLATMDKKGIVFELDAPLTVAKLKGDRTQLMQVLMNLLKNAIDALNESDTAHKSIKVKVVANETEIRILITDNGKGFDEEIGNNLFSRGYTTKLEGTGQGLVNARKTIEAHNGTINITSEGPGKGAVATVIFHL